MVKFGRKVLTAEDLICVVDNFDALVSRIANMDIWLLYTV